MQIFLVLRVSCCKRDTYNGLGNVGEEIIDTAIQNEADLIVMGSHGYSGLQRMLLGSTGGYRTGAEARRATDPLLIVDDSHYLHRFHLEQPRAVMGIEQPEQTRPLANRFDEIWATGESGVSGTVLGL